MTFVLGLSGSLRKGSYTTALLRAATRNLPHDVRMEIADISSLPLYNRDLEAGGVLPDAVRDFRAHCTTADAFLFAIPEATFGMPGPLKNALDWTFRNQAITDKNAMSGKVCAVIGVGTVDQPQFYFPRIKEWAQSMNMITLDRTIYVNKNSVSLQAFDIKGKVVDPEIQKNLKALIQEMAETARKTQKH